jgi:hypothetical protein
MIFDIRKTLTAGTVGQLQVLKGLAQVKQLTGIFQASD